MSLGDSFPGNFRSEYSKRNIQPGAVIKIMDHSAKPRPKEKRFIIVSESYDHISIATVYINSEINTAVFKNNELKNLQLSLTKNESRSYIDWDSYVDCSKIKKFRKEELINHLEQNPHLHIGFVSTSDLSTILSKIKIAKTISKSEKKEWGFV